MMPLAPERNTMCVPAKPKADFSIDFIVGNNNKATAINNNSIGRSSPPAASRRGSPSSPLGARQASPPPSASPPASSLGSPTTPAAVLDEDDIRARLLGLQAAQAAQAAALPGAGALHGLLHHHHHHHHHHPLGGPLCAPPPASPPSDSPSPPHSPTAGVHPPPPLPQPFLLRGLYRPEPLQLHPQLHPQLQPHLLHAHPGALPGHPHPVPGVAGVPHHGIPLGPPKDSYPLYPWLLSRHGRIFPHRFPGVGGPDFAGFLLHPFRKPKRIRTAFSPSQLLKLEHAFENNHYVVGAERKQVAQALGLSETQVKVWFQNRRTKHKRTEQEEEAKKRSTNNNSGGGKHGEDSSSPSNSGGQQQAWHEDERDARPSHHRPVDLSGHEDSHDDDSSGAESEC